MDNQNNDNLYADADGQQVYDFNDYGTISTIEGDASEADVIPIGDGTTYSLINVSYDDDPDFDSLAVANPYDEYPPADDTSFFDDPGSFGNDPDLGGSDLNDLFF